MDAGAEVAMRLLYVCSVAFGVFVLLLMWREYSRGMAEGAYLQGLIDGGKIRDDVSGNAVKPDAG